MQKTTGKLTGTIEALDSRIKDQSETLSDIEKRLSRVTHAIYAAGVAFTVVMFIAGVLGKMVWDVMVEVLSKLVP